MHWFGGSIAEAVTLSKQRNAIFVVFVEGMYSFSLYISKPVFNSSILLSKTCYNGHNFCKNVGQIMSDFGGYRKYFDVKTNIGLALEYPVP